MATPFRTKGVALFNVHRLRGLTQSIAYVLLEHAVEVLRILVSQLIGNLADRLPASYNHFFGQIDDFVLDIFLRRCV